MSLYSFANNNFGQRNYRKSRPCYTSSEIVNYNLKVRNVIIDKHSTCTTASV